MIIVNLYRVCLRIVYLFGQFSLPQYFEVQTSNYWIWKYWTHCFSDLHILE